MSDEYKGCRNMAALPHAFNDFGHMAGMSRDLTFVDTDLVLKVLEEGNQEMPEYHAIILAFAGPFEYEPVGKPTKIQDHNLGLITFSADVRQIPDVYAFLHAVLNSTPDTATGMFLLLLEFPNSVLHNILARCRSEAKPQRTAIIKTAADLRKAYLPAVRKWSLPRLTAESTSTSATTTSPKEAPRFFVFVQSTQTRTIVLVDGNDIIPLARTTEVSPHGVLCNRVKEAIASLRKLAGPDIESCTFGLTTHSA